MRSATTRQAAPLQSESVDNASPNGHLNGQEKEDWSPPWPTWIEVDLDAVASNVRVLSARLAGRAGVLAVVKAQAYGLGAGPIAEAALRAGARGLAVARVAEGVQLRRRGVDCPILLMGPIGVGEEDEVVGWELTTTLADMDTAVRLAAAADRAGKIVPVHVKADTGLSRFGALAHELLPLVAKANALAPLLVEGLYTHFAAPDEDPAYTREQLRRFFELQQLLRAHGYDFRVRHAASSAAMLRYAEAHLELVRPGITLLGAYPSPSTPRVEGLRPAFQFKARVARVYDLPAGASVGYGRAYRAPTALRAALVPVGYADGIPRCAFGRGQVLVRGRRAPLIGRVSMDQCVVDVTRIPGVRPGDEVVLIGRQGEEAIELDEVAAWAETIPHEVLTRLGPRVPRVYLRSGKPVYAALLNAEACLEVPAPVPLA